jgi:hypothetical protein
LDLEPKPPPTATSRITTSSCGMPRRWLTSFWMNHGAWVDVHSSTRPSRQEASVVFGSMTACDRLG